MIRDLFRCNFRKKVRDAVRHFLEAIDNSIAPSGSKPTIHPGPGTPIFQRQFQVPVVIQRGRRLHAPGVQLDRTIVTGIHQRT